MSGAEVRASGVGRRASDTVRLIFSRYAAASALALAALGCSRGERVALGETKDLSAPTALGMAPMFAVSPSGARAAAWVSAPEGGTDGRLYVLTSGQPAEITDTLGPVEAHGESPPKLVYGADGSLDALYVVAKVVPGKRFPLAALRFVRSADGGKTWTSPVTVTDDTVFGSHNFHALHAAADGSLYAAWLDGRQGKSAAFVTRSTDGGKTWLPNVRVSMGEACPCCRTAIATAKDGTLYLAWRTVFPGNVRDVVVARSTDHGATFAEPVRAHADNWLFDGCPHAGPALAVDSSGAVHVAWWTGKQGAAGAFYARSTDGAKSFSAPVALGVAEYSQPAHVQLALGQSGRVVVAWDDGTLKVPRVMMRVSTDGGAHFADAQPVSADGASATFPVLGVAGHEVTVAWAEQSAAAAAREMQAMPNMKDPKAAMGLHAVGESTVKVRSGTLP